MLKSKAAALIKLPTKKQLQPGCDFQKLVWSSKHFKLTTSLQPLNEKFLILAGKKHVVCKLHQGNIKEELQKTIKVTIGDLGSKLESSLSDTWFLLHYKITIILFLRVAFTLVTFLLQSFILTLLQNLVEVDIQPECRCWKMLMFLFVLLWCSKLIGNPAFFWESICTKFLFSSFFPCYVGSSFQKLFNVFRVSLIHWFLFFYYFLINFWLNHSFKGYWISTNFRASLANLEEN